MQGEDGALAVLVVCVGCRAAVRVVGADCELLEPQPTAKQQTLTAAIVTPCTASTLTAVSETTETAPSADAASGHDIGLTVVNPAVQDQVHEPADPRAEHQQREAAEKKPGE